jgi:predicted DNA-binding protein
MRTTIEIPDEQRARLLDLAARRGEKGFSRLVQEAVDAYLQDIERREEVVRRALAVLGTLSQKSERRMKSSLETLRSRWR